MFLRNQCGNFSAIFFPDVCVCLDFHTHTLSVTNTQHTVHSAPHTVYCAFRCVTCLSVLSSTTGNPAPRLHTTQCTYCVCAAYTVCCVAPLCTQHPFFSPDRLHSVRVCPYTVYFPVSTGGNSNPTFRDLEIFSVSALANYRDFSARIHPGFSPCPASAGTVVIPSVASCPVTRSLGSADCLLHYNPFDSPGCLAGSTQRSRANLPYYINYVYTPPTYSRFVVARR